MKKDYSFDKEKAIDVEAVEKSTDTKGMEKKLSFKDKLKIAGGKIQKASENLKEYQKKSHATNMEKLKRNVEKTKLEAQLAKNKSQIEKYQNKGKKKNDPFDFGGGFF